jgi:phosphinothricin acetyltransferase
VVAPTQEIYPDMRALAPSFEVIAAEEIHLPGITAIYNQAVRDTTAIWSETEVTLDQRRQWMRSRRAAGFPVLAAVAADPDRSVIGYGSYGTFRDFPGFSRTVEHSVYVRPDAQRRGVGRELLRALLTLASRSGLDVMVGCIAAGNDPSVALHRGLGFQEEGRLTGVGRKFNQRLDLIIMTRQLSPQPDAAPPHLHDPAP